MLSTGKMSCGLCLFSLYSIQDFVTMQKYWKSIYTYEIKYKQCEISDKVSYIKISNKWNVWYTTYVILLYWDYVTVYYERKTFSMGRYATLYKNVYHTHWNSRSILKFGNGSTGAGCVRRKQHPCGTSTKWIPTESTWYGWQLQLVAAGKRVP